MSGYDIYKKALLRLGYNSSGINDNKISMAKELINQVLNDLKLEEINEMSSKIKASKSYLEAVCCGLAMLLSLSEGDSAKNQLFCDLYNAKRAAILSEISLIEDKLPIAGSGDE